jgi:DNA-binding SARP family transcriptional activator
MVEEFHQTANAVKFESLVHYRLSALAHKVTALGRTSYSIVQECDREVKVLLGERPGLASTASYLQYLRAVVIAARAENDLDMIRAIEGRLDRFLVDPQVDEAVRLQARRSLMIYFLDIFDTAEELARRLEMLSELETIPGRPIVMLPWHRSILLYEIGEVRQVVANLSQVIPRLRDHGLRRSLFQGRLLLLCARTVLGEPMSAVETEMRAIIDEAPPELRKMASNSICSHLLEAALLRGERQWSARIFDEFEPLAQRVFSDYQIMRSIASGDFSSLASGRMIHDALQGIVDCYVQTPRDRSRIIEAAQSCLHSSFVRFESITIIRCTLELVRRMETEEPGLDLISELRPSITDAIVTSLRWLVEREIYPCADALLDDFEELAEQERIAQWKEKLAEQSKAARKQRTQLEREARLKLSMLGTIEIVKQDGEAIRPRGARLRTLLGLMVADRMLDKPLSSREFYLLAAGEEDIDRARNTVHVAMHRLRESVGMDEAFTAVEKPRLNLDLFDVDLLEARRLLREGDAAARSGAWMRASSAIVAALALTGSDVPFPSLYDTFFEAAREDFENELRDTVMRVSRGLLDEDDPASAQEILAAAFEAMPDDEEVGSLLHTALTRLGRRTEAERVRMRSSEVTGN